MKQLEDYLPFYLGCEYVSSIKGMEKGTIAGFSVSEYSDFVDLRFIDEDGQEVTIPTNCFDEIKLVLRHLSDMTDDEETEYTLLVEKWNFGFRRNMLGAASATKYLLSKHFDLFGLIDAGLAIIKSPE